MSERKSIPLSVSEVCEAVRQGRTVPSSRLDRILGTNEVRRLVEVQAGVTWRALAEYLRPGDERAASIRTTEATIGDSVARNAAGPDGRSTVTHVESLTLVTADGQVRRVNRQSDAELFALAVGGQGLFGLLYSITLRLDTMASTVNHTECSMKAGAPAAARALELLVPRDAVDRFLAAAHERCADWRMPVEEVEVRLTHAEDETFLRWARGEYAEVNLRLPDCHTLSSRVRWTQLTRELIDAAISVGGRFQIASTMDATREQAQACYPELETFLSHKRRVDPEEKLVNSWYARQQRLLSGERCLVSWLH